MRPSLKIAITVSLPALLAASLSLSSCAADGCVVDPSDPRCTAGPSLDVDLLTNRLAKSGGRLLVKVLNFKQGEQIEVTLGTGGPKVSGFLQQSDGSWEAMVSSSVLTNIPIGPLSALLTVGTKTQMKTLHIYTPAVFMEDSKKISFTPSSRNPNWVGVSQGHIFARLDNGADNRLNEYQVSGTTLMQLAARDSHLSLLPLNGFIDISELHTFRLPQPSGTTATLEYGDLNPISSSLYKVIKTLMWSKTHGLAVDRQSKLLAIAGEGAPDGGLKVYTVPPMADPMTAASVTVNGAPSGKQASLLAFALIDNDALLDLVTVHTDNSFAVYLQAAGTGLTYNAAFSMGLNTAAGLQAGVAPAFAVGDVDRDGLDDVMISASGSMQVFQLANEGNGTFTKTSLVSGVSADVITIGDVNGDSKVDLVVGTKTPANLYCYPNQSP